MAPARAEVTLSPLPEYKNLDQLPVPKRPIHVRFPLAIRRKGNEDRIVLRFTVTKTGEVTNLTVVNFSDADMIDAAYRAFDGLRFSPGMKNGQPVEAVMEVVETGAG